MKHYEDEYGDLGYDDEAERMSHSYDGMLALFGIAAGFWFVLGCVFLGLAWWLA